MAATAIETIPTLWDDERDNAFFRITAALFSCEFTYGAGVLLASYDDDFDVEQAPAFVDPATATSSSQVSSATAAHATRR